MEYDQETLDYIKQMEADREKLRGDNSSMQRDYGQLSMYQSINPTNLAELQLDLAREKSLVEHVLRAHVLRRDETTGKEDWFELNDPSRKIFTEYGVDRLMNFINIYISLNIILSYYLPEEVLAKMKIIADELADIFYLEYEYLFYKPTFKDMIVHKKITESDIYEMSDEELIKLYHDLKFEAEVIYAKNQKQVYMIHNMLVNAVHSSYNRALWGKERDSLRKMMHISEGNSLTTQQRMQGNGNSKFKWYNPVTW